MNLRFFVRRTAGPRLAPLAGSKAGSRTRSPSGLPDSDSLRSLDCSGSHVSSLCELETWAVTDRTSGSATRFACCIVPATASQRLAGSSCRPSQIVRRSAEKEALRRGLLFLRVAGLEPARHRCRRILSPLRLPIPPYPRWTFRDSNPGPIGYEPTALTN